MHSIYNFCESFSNELNMLEVIFVSESGNAQSSCSVWDYRTGTNLMTYKSGSSLQRRSLNMIKSEYVLGANESKPLLHVWPVNSPEQFLAVRFVLPGKADAAILSPDGHYLLVGVQETLFIWNIKSGRMLNTINKHYQPICCLRFTDDGSHFVSGSRDGAVLVWNLTQVVTPNDDDNETPLHSFSDHGLPVTDVHIGGGGLRAYMYTVSLDRSCKIYDLSSGVLLLNLVFTEALHSVVANALETSVYVGSGQGKIYEFHIDAAPRTKEYHLEKSKPNVFEGHELTASINCLVLSLDGHTLISGGQDGQVCIWYIATRHLLRAMRFKGPITNLYLRLTTPTIFAPGRKQPNFFNGSLQRMMNSSGLDDEDTLEVLVTEASEYELRNLNESFVPKDGCEVSLNSKSDNTLGKPSSSTDDIEELRSEIRYLKNVNKALFELSTKKLLKNDS